MEQEDTSSDLTPPTSHSSRERRGRGVARGCGVAWAWRGGVGVARERYNALLGLTREGYFASVGQQGLARGRRQLWLGLVV